MRNEACIKAVSMLALWVWPSCSVFMACVEHACQVFALC
jgi:hypothetical protein